MTVAERQFARSEMALRQTGYMALIGTEFLPLGSFSPRW